jgi:hypothetical protein
MSVEIIEADPSQEITQLESGTLFGSSDPRVVLERATAMSKVLMDVVKSQHLSVRIGPKNHLLFEAWQFCGTMLGIFAVGVWTRPMKEDGVTVAWEARAEARTRDGAVVGAAEAMCSRSEAKWAKADEYAVRSMAQTRAASKALAGALRFVAVLAGFAGTPAEEMPRGDAQSVPKRRPTDRWAERPKTGIGSACKLCADAGLMATSGAAPEFRKTKRGDIQCNGRLKELNDKGEQGWANHPMPLTAAETEAADARDDGPITF